MAASQTIPIIIADGAQGFLEDPEALSLPGDAKVAVRLQDGPCVWVPRQLLSPREDGSYHIPLTLKQLEAHSRSGEETDNFQVLPVVREELSVEKRRVETGRTRIHKQVLERQEIIDEPLEREEVLVERVPVNQIICDPVPTVRQEGDTLIIPLLEEVLVVEKRVMLREEVHIRRKRTIFHSPQQITLRSEEVSVDRIDLPDASQKNASDPKKPAAKQPDYPTKKERSSRHGRARPKS